MQRTQTLAGLLLFLVSTACGAPDGGTLLGEDGIDELTQEFGEASCGTGMANATLDIHFRIGSTTSPTTYGSANCLKTWTVQLAGTIPITANGSISWTDRWDRNSVQCKNGKTRFQILSWAPNESIRDDGQFTFPLFWDAAQAVCFYPSVEFTKDHGSTRLRPLYSPGRRVFRDPGIPGDRVFMELPVDLTGRSVRLAGQALTPSGNTQSIHFNLQGSEH